MAGTALDTLRDRVEALLTDSSNAEWSTAELDQAIRLALSELSSYLPVAAATTVDAVDGVYEYDLSAITGPVGVLEVWYPYLAGTSVYGRPRPVQWRMISDTRLMIEPEEEPDAAYDLRIFYEEDHTLEGLDSATATTLSAAEKSALVIGAAGYAAIAKARGWTNEVTVGGDAVSQLERWGKARLDAFTAALERLAERAVGDDDARVSWDGVD